jgi:hypothetical protein
MDDPARFRPGQPHFQFLVLTHEWTSIMKIIAYAEADRTALGVVTSPTHFVAVADIAPDMPTSLIAILEQEGGLAQLQKAAQGREGNRTLASVTLKPFLDRPNAMWALALNFKSHIAVYADRGILCGCRRANRRAAGSDRTCLRLRR